MEHSTPQIYTEFLPISRADMEARGWEQLDFVVVGGDAYVDHPSFGTAIISRLLEAEGYKVGVLAYNQLLIFDGNIISLIIVSGETDIACIHGESFPEGNY